MFYWIPLSVPIRISDSDVDLSSNCVQCAVVIIRIAVYLFSGFMYIFRYGICY